MIVLLYMWQKKALNIYRSFCGISFSTKTFKKILVADVDIARTSSDSIISQKCFFAYLLI
ncbi:MAG: hypothetical protein DSZ17_00570 [Candidatus Thioglobus sp.]|nr:MAG: hypothetical protein DSZ17_00570 [Candidatus Thioglobus sp.]